MRVEYIDHMGSDASVVKAARVSFANEGDEERTEDQDEKLISYLAKHQHWTPFAHTAITLRMTAPIPIRTQCFKHKQGFVENEESRRYISNEPEYFVPTFRGQVTNKKQGSGSPLCPSTKIQSLITGGLDNIKCVYSDYMDLAIEQYEQLLGEGVCEEQARFVLPQGCMVNWYWTGSLSAYARFYNQRSNPHAQVEVQDLASMVGSIIEDLYPISWNKLTWG